MYLHWDGYKAAMKAHPAYYTMDRWEYYQVAREWASGERVLECGPHYQPLCLDALYLDNVDHGHRPLLLHDLNKPIPLPGGFDLCLALQVVEHLEDPMRAIADMLRVARVLIVSVPYCWPKTSDPGHEGIDDKVIRLWTAPYDVTHSRILGKAPYQRAIMRIEA